MRLSRTKKLLLVDAFGAAISAIFLLFLIPKFEDTFGIGTKISLPLGGLATILFLNSFFLFLKHKEEDSKSLSLKIVAITNTSYIFISFLILVLNWEIIGVVGKTYLVLEKVIVLGLSYLEFRSFKGTLLTVSLFLIFGNCQPKSSEEYRGDIKERFVTIAKEYSIEAQLFIESEKHNFKMEEGFQSSGSKPFHGASMAKLMTGVLLLQLAEEGKVRLSDPVTKYLSTNELQGVINSPEKVTLEMLVNHTSGANDWFGGEEIKSSTFLNSLVKDPNQIFTPQKLLLFARENQRPIGEPGEMFYYSDTGFLLLTLAMENITNKSWSDNLKERFFIPLQMNTAYVFRGSQTNQDHTMSRLRVLGKELTSKPALSCDYGGGGVVASAEDFSKFLKALVRGQLKVNWKSMIGEREFHSGIFYGNGMMKVDFGKMSILMPRTSLLYGHSGVLGTYFFYVPNLDMIAIVNFGNTDAIDKSFELLFHITYGGDQIFAKSL